MKYTARPVTQNARNKKAASQSPARKNLSTFPEGEEKKTPAATPGGGQGGDSSSNEQSRIITTTTREAGEDGMMYDVTRKTGNSSGDANALKNASAPQNDLGKAKGGRQATTTAEKSSYNDWVIDQISSGKQSAQHMADMKYISKDRVGEYAKHAPEQKVNTSANSNSKSSSEETWTPVMTDAVDPKTQVQTRAHEKRSSNRQWITSNMVNRVAASSQIRRAKRDGLFLDGELTDKGRSSLSPKQQKGLMGAWDTKRGRSADQLAHTNRTGKYAHGGNTHAGEEFVTEEGKASVHMKATEGTVAATSSKPNSVKETKVDAKGLDPRATHTYGANVPQIKRSKTLPKTERQLQNEADAIVKESFSDPAEFKDKSAFLMKRSHSSKSPAKMWNTDVSPAKEGERLEHAPKNAKKVAAKEKADKNARWAAASPAKMWGPSKVKAGKGGFNRKK